MQIANCKSQINFASRNLHSVDQAVAAAIKCSLSLSDISTRYRYIGTDTSAQYKCVCQEIHAKPKNEKEITKKIYKKYKNQREREIKKTMCRRHEDEDEEIAAGLSRNRNELQVSESQIKNRGSKNSKKYSQIQADRQSEGE